ncbi:unnamed protein product [Plasmodium vivax]|uniref:(malaria parasite P. vivax) hypothetical protein n=1 Tax=Plasmodium vivax TaxID=5855 RepID=A0A8S4H406_PLAVI|nr:unnamed protein product [Plasmodium vivax]
MLILIYFYVHLYIPSTYFILQPTYEKGCKLSQYINGLDNNIGIDRVQIKDQLQSVEQDKQHEVEAFFAILSKNYTSINTYCKGIETYCYSYLNHWLDKQKQSNKISVSNATWEVIENSWDILKQNDKFSCERKRYVESLPEKDKCIDLMVYCVNREELKNQCKNPEDGEEFKETFCKNFNEYTNKYYNKFNSESFCLDCTTRYNDYIPAFHESCTLYDIPKTFPKYYNSTNTISEDTSKNSIKNCLQPKVSFSISTLPWKYGLYGVSSLIGFSCLSIFLYKKRTRGSFSSNSPSKKITSKHTDKQHSQELTKKNNSKNKHYNFSYSPTKN